MKAPVTTKGEGAPREVPPEGNYLAVCRGVYMLGTQPGYNGGAARPQMMLEFELHKRKGPAKAASGHIYTADRIMNHTFNVESMLAVYAGALNGKTYTDDDLKEIEEQGGFDPESLLGLPCRLSIKHEKKGDTVREKIESVSRLDPEDDVPPKGELDEVYWDWTGGEEPPKRISYFWDRAAENPKAKKAPAPAMAGAASGDDPDCPF